MTTIQPWPSGPFACITADPPWIYEYPSRAECAGTGWRGGSDDKYDTMSLDAIKAMPVESVAADDAVLWLWVVNSQLIRCLEVVDAWGFSYRGALTWAKTTSNWRTPYCGNGYWLRGATEHAVFAVRGKPPKPSAAIPTWFAAPWCGHSVKPQTAVEIFERFSPGPRLELFARRPRDGWVTWGNDPALHLEPEPVLW